MRLTYLARLLARLATAGLLCSIAGYVLAQEPMDIRQGSRHAGPGAIDPSASAFALGITRDGGASFVSRASVAETVEIRGEVRPEPQNVGQIGDIFFVDRLLTSSGEHAGFKMRNQDGVWLDWNGNVEILVPFRESVVLNANHQITLFNGTLGVVGDHDIFIGYMAPDGILRYHTIGLPVTITAAQTETPRQQALALFTSSIHGPIVQNNCISCHVAGDPLTGGVHQFAQGSGQAQIDANFQIFSGMIGRGKDYILGKVRGEQGHLGGAALPRGFPGYADFEAFLTLLEQR